MFAAHINAAEAMTGVRWAKRGELPNTVAETTSQNVMVIKPSLPARTAVHEVVQARQFAGNWNQGDDLHDEAEAWALEYLLATSIFLRKLEDAINANDGALARSSWLSAWNPVNGFPGIIGTFAPKPGTNGTVGRAITAADLWDVNNHMGVRFSASNLGMVYNQTIAARGIIDPATGNVLVLNAPPPATPPGPLD